MITRQVAALVALIHIATAWTAAYAQAPSAIEAKITTGTGQVFTTAVSIDFPFDRHRQLIANADTSRPMDCLLFGFVAKCLSLKQGVYSSDLIDAASANDKRVFVRPVSQVSIWLSGRRDDKDFGKLATQVSGPRQPVPVPRVGQPITFYKKIIGNEYFITTYQTTFEPVGVVQDGKLALQRLDDMLNTDFPTECPSPSVFDYSEGSYCSGVFRWTSNDDRSGHAWCKYMWSGIFRSAPFDCVALSVRNAAQTYVRAFPSPFYGEGFGQAIGGLSCQGESALVFSKVNVQLIIDVLRQPPLEVNMGELAPGNRAFWHLDGVRRNVRSPINKQVFEWTTFNLMAMDDRVLGLTLTGGVVPGMSGTIMASLEQAHNLNEADLEAYREFVTSTLTKALSQAFGQKVICTIQ